MVMASIKPGISLWSTTIWLLLGTTAIVSSEVATNGTRTYFLDRSSVVRPGGRALPRARPALRLATSDSEAALNPPGAGVPSTWRARVDQFAAHVGQFETRTRADIVAFAGDWMAKHFGQGEGSHPPRSSPI